jgi:hypothetical protein
MSRYKSEQTAYNPLKKKNVPLWRLDTNTLTVTHFNPETHTEEHKTYYSDYVKYHLHYSDSHCPDRLRKIVNEGRIIQYLDDLETKVQSAIDSQVERWKADDTEYRVAVLCSDRDKKLVLKIALSIWREKLFLSVWFIFDLAVDGCACGVQPF